MLLASLAPILLTVSLGSLGPLGSLGFAPGTNDADDDKNKQTIEGEILKTLKDNGVITDQQYKDLMSKAAKMRAERVDTDAELEKSIKRLNDSIDRKSQASKTAGESATASVSFENGFYLRSADNKFSFHPWIVLRERMTYVDAGNIPGPLTPAQKLTYEDTLSFEARPVRIWFDGHAFSEDLTYLVMFNVASSTGILCDAYLDYRFDEAFHVRAGQQKRPVDFEGFTYAPRVVMLEKAPSVLFYQGFPGREFDAGVSVWGQADEKRLEYRFGIFNGEGANNGASLTNLGPGGVGLIPTSSNNNDSSGVEAAGRIMYSPWGGFEPDKVGYVEGDYGRSEDPKLGFGLAGGLNPERVSLVGTPPVPTKIITNTYTWSADVEFKYQGWFAIAEGFYQTVINKTSNTSNLGNAGYFGQVGYFFGSDTKNRGFEVIARYSDIDVDSPVPVAGGPPASAVTGTHDYTLGLNYVFAGHRLKIQSAYTYREAVIRALNNVYDNIFQLQIQLVL